MLPDHFQSTGILCQSDKSHLLLTFANPWLHLQILEETALRRKRTTAEGFFPSLLILLIALATPLYEEKFLLRNVNLIHVLALDKWILRFLAWSATTSSMICWSSLEIQMGDGKKQEWGSCMKMYQKVATKTKFETSGAHVGSPMPTSIFELISLTSAQVSPV